MKARGRLIKDDMHGIHYAVSIFFATGVLYILIHRLAKTNPIWAISSMVATTDPLMKQARRQEREAFRSAGRRQQHDNDTKQIGKRYNTLQERGPSLAGVNVAGHSKVTFQVHIARRMACLMKTSRVVHKPQCENSTPELAFE